MQVLLRWVYAIVAAVVVALLLRTFVFEIVVVSGQSMENALHAGDCVLVTKFDYWGRSPDRYDVVAFNVEGMNGRLLKRCVGLPGETVEIREGATIVNGELLPEIYLSSQDSESFAPISIPSSYYMLLGDNRAQSHDSRSYDIGLVGGRQVVGRARMVLWPPADFGGID